MNVIVPALAILFLMRVAYQHGKKDGSHGGWAAAWKKARQRFQRKRHDQ